jgi:hypothetical protein
MRIGRLLPLAAAAALSLLSSCSSEPPGPIEGTLNLTLGTPNPDDGAVLFTVSGGPVDSVEASGFAVYSARVDANTLRVIVAGELGSGRLARIHIPDSREIGRYSAAMVQVAARVSYQQRSPEGYVLTLAP